MNAILTVNLERLEDWMGQLPTVNEEQRDRAYAARIQEDINNIRSRFVKEGSKNKERWHPLEMD